MDPEDDYAQGGIPSSINGDSASIEKSEGDSNVPSPTAEDVKGGNEGLTGNNNNSQSDDAYPEVVQCGELILRVPQSLRRVMQRLRTRFAVPPHHVLEMLLLARDIQPRTMPFSAPPGAGRDGAVRMSEVATADELEGFSLAAVRAVQGNDCVTLEQLSKQGSR